MNNIELLGHTCIGASHISSGKPCQDHSLNYSWDYGKLMIVSDGHGSDKYFRSDRGSKIAVEVTKTAIVSFVENFSSIECLPNFKSRGICGISDESSDDYTPIDYDYESTFRHLFDYIVSEWYRLITEDWANNPPTDEEYEKADSTKSGKVKSFFNNSTPDLAKAYGCTLIAAVRAKEYWFAFQLGDGKCIAFNDDGTWFEPIPWDSRCFLNQTTSLSGQGSESFRYCIGSKHIPALFIGSDGMDDSYPPVSCLANWYKLILKKINEHNCEKVQEMLVDFLPQLSKQGSKDDMSLRFWVDTDNLSELCNKIIQKDIIEKKENCDKLENEISSLSTDIFTIQNNIETIISQKNEANQLLQQSRNRLNILKSTIDELRYKLQQTEDEYKRQNDSILLGEKDIKDKEILLSSKEGQLSQAKTNKQNKQAELEKIKDELVASEKILNSDNTMEETQHLLSEESKEKTISNQSQGYINVESTDIPTI